MFDRKFACLNVFGHNPDDKYVPLDMETAGFEEYAQRSIPGIAENFESLGGTIELESHRECCADVSQLYSARPSMTHLRNRDS